MTIKSHQTSKGEIAELISDDLIINDVSDGLDLMGNVYYNGFDSVIIHAKNITPEFFDLKTKIAGEILQKFSNYRMKLAIVGEFENIESKSLQDFIRESNKFGHVNFVGTTEEALEKLNSF